MSYASLFLSSLCIFSSRFGSLRIHRPWLKQRGYQNMATADRMQTTAGSWALLGSLVPKDAHIVYLLRKAGAVILGKTNLDEWAGMRGSNYSVGYSARGGQCRNPFDLTKSPGKSTNRLLPRMYACADVSGLRGLQQRQCSVCIN